MNYNQRVKKYYELYDKALAIREEIDPCIIIDGVCQRGRAGKTNLCCQTNGGCKYLTEDGCTTKALRCMIWYCEYANVSPEAKKALKKLWKEADHYGLLYFRQGDKESLFYAKSFYLRNKVKIVRESRNLYKRMRDFLCGNL